MTNEKRFKLDMPFEEALRRLAQTDPKELTDAFQENRQRAEEVRRSAEGRRERLKSAIRGPRKRNNS